MLLDQKELGINVSGEHVTHHRFTDVFIIVEALENLNTVLEAHNVSQWMGLIMNMDKTKILLSIQVAPSLVSITLPSKLSITKFTYLGQTVQL
jgi:hypothetical protein